MTTSNAWEPVVEAGATWRLAVPGGWLYRYVYPADEAPVGQIMCFVPDQHAKHVMLPPGTSIEPEGTSRT